MNFDEQNTESYNWDQGGVYVIEPTDYVEGGEDGVSNRQAKELTRRTRNLHSRMTTAQGEIDTLQEQLPIATEAALRTSKEYTDGKDTVLRNDMAVADTSTLGAAKAYADRVVAALVDNSPEALNTLQELATALGNDPNFATTVMQQIGERVKTTDFNNALAGKANSSHSHAVDDVPEVWHAGNFNPADKANIDSVIKEVPRNSNILWGNCTGFMDESTPAGQSTSFISFGMPGYDIQLALGGYSNWQGGWNRLFFRSKNGDNGSISDWKELYHSRNLVPATTTANGLMSAADKTKLDAQPAKIIRGSVNADGYVAGGNAFLISPLSDSVVRVTHYIGNTNYAAIATVNCSGVQLTSDNEVNMWQKSNNYVDFIVTNGGGQDREFVPFDFIIIPY